MSKTPLPASRRRGCSFWDGHTAILNSRRTSSLEQFPGDSSSNIQKLSEGLWRLRGGREWCLWYGERREWLNMEPPQEEVKGARREITQALIRKIWINAAGQVRTEGEIPEPPEPSGRNRVVAILPPEEEREPVEDSCRSTSRYGGTASDEGLEVGGQGG